MMKRRGEAWTTKGTSQILKNSFQSRFLGEKRNIRICLPASYRIQFHRHYPVLYLHDGQNMFCSNEKDVAFGWGSWELDSIVSALCKERKMQEIIMVAVDYTTVRIEEYAGRRRLDGSSTVKTAFEKYEEFLTNELKPWMDRDYRTLPDAQHTAVMGSSLGGLCSLVLAWSHPEVFGGAASLSGAFPVSHPNFVDDVLKEYNGLPKPFRVYLDSGVVDLRGGDDGCSRTEQVEAELRRIGWSFGNLQRYVDRKTLTRGELGKTGLPREKWAEARISQHNELYWRRRAWRALTFLFPLSSPGTGLA